MMKELLVKALVLIACVPACAVDEPVEVSTAADDLETSTDGAHGIPQSTGGGCGDGSDAGTTLRACISAQNEVALPDYYVVVRGSCTTTFWELFKNGTRIASGNGSCSQGHHNVGSWKGAGVYFLRVHANGSTGAQADSPFLTTF
jgi:hypothetical protein